MTHLTRPPIYLPLSQYVQRNRGMRQTRQEFGQRRWAPSPQAPRAPT